MVASEKIQKKSRYRLYSGIRKNAQGGGAIRNHKKLGIYFYSGFRKTSHGGGAIQNPKSPGIDFSGFSKTSLGGGAIRNFKKFTPPPNLKTWIRHFI